MKACFATLPYKKSEYDAESNITKRVPYKQKTLEFVLDMVLQITTYICSPFILLSGQTCLVYRQFHGEARECNITKKSSI